ncbi:MAG: ribosome biogenesis GTPase Der [Pseudomonadota bacterium]
MPLKIAIVGRPNVGKSTLFNRLVGKRLALVDDQPGVTRDRREGEGRLGDLPLTIIDTAGLERDGDHALSSRMRAQTEVAISDADVALMLVDARAGITPMDHYFAEWLRKQDVPYVLVANKSEGRRGEAGLYDAFQLGLGDPIALSAEHGEGMADLFEALVQIAEARFLDQDTEEAEEDASGPLKLAIVGRPNAGKSTLINRLTNEDRLITGPEAGITRDSISVPWVYNGRAILLFDTAGLRKRARVTAKLEKLSVADGLRAVRFAEIVVVLIDATLGLESQDLRIANQVWEEGRGLVIALNKWDLVEDPQAVLKKTRNKLETSLAQAKDVPFITLSAASGQGTKKLMPAVFKLYEEWNKRVSTARLNEWLRDTVDEHPPPAVSGRRLKARYATQIKVRPPTVAVFVNRPEDFPMSYRRYLTNALRRDFKFGGTPLRLLLRKTENPYEGRRKKRT